MGELATPRLAESGSRRLSDSPSFSFKHSKADSPTRRFSITNISANSKPKAERRAVRRGSVGMVRRGQLVARQFSAQHHREVSPTELTSDEEMERGPGEWRRINVLYECATKSLKAERLER